MLLAGPGGSFILSALLLDQLKGAFTWVKEHYVVVNRVSGAFLIGMGVLMATGTLGVALRAMAG